MGNKKRMLSRCIAATFVFTGFCFANIQDAKAVTTLSPNNANVLNSDKVLASGLATVSSKTVFISTINGSTDTNKGKEAVNYALQLLGKPYSYGANGPNAFDCSGFTQYVYGECGFNLSRTTYTQVEEGTEVDRSSLIPGDLVFFNTYGSTSHVGIYIGNGEFVHAPRTGKPVMISFLDDDYYSSRFAAGRRIFN
ncbi:C40 family peptidase [Clostridium saccharobutylicum]|uniref:Cell wall-associated hydrolase, invasion-associated protein n=1 Tax=Clostridium saccharobutylicum DSM 13864 TaxID=1345695 RepID=U5MPK6_CLOSA|nr:C40 family peptidase [Clostridium saccharobutylicum]AGX41621.1 cell wall-associated hydrolase, invasion-associated protein [Clostridium saccharobutylicum DSM 13864]AQR88903.1 murein DD-endopeptidase MepH precursor [Clostridium saccharobutylicum]AQR98804.1 murein DD-endopeptidase MepH precursor [Clostridium saccharobutylicum]AQS12792.1 murein DD-endopeptidase MepH precursor [Clostridium saccharobutylicum]MBA2904096.1 cell wall-associated NlpC family hydrolase [Clostridium saccharobutylicum]